MNTAEVIIPKNEIGNYLAPLETSTRVPLPIWAPGDGSTNRHHAHFYRRNFENGPPSTRAVRFSRLQAIRKDPHRRYHEAFDGALLPDSEQEAFNIAVLNCAGYIPPYVVDLSSRSFSIQELSPSMKSQLLQPGVFSMERKNRPRADIGQFLMNFAINQNFDHVRQSQIEEFLSITPEMAEVDPVKKERKHHLGLRLTSKAIEVAVDPVNEPFKRAKRGELLRVGAPVCAFLVVKHYVSGHETDYLETLEERLANEYAA